MRTDSGPTSILTMGYSGKNIITSQDRTHANLPHLGPSNTLTCDANGRVLKVTAKKRVNRPGLPPEVGNGIITQQAQHSLMGCSAFANQGLIMIFHPHFEGVTMYQPEDDDITYKGKPVISGYREESGNKFW